MDKAFWIVIVAGLVTLAIRFSPFVLFSRGEGVSHQIRFLGNTLPPAIMATLILMTLRHVDVFSGTHGIPEFAGVIVTALLHIWRRSTLISIAGGTALYMVLIRVL